MEKREAKSSGRDGKQPWRISFILLIALMPATANIFLYSFVMLSTAKEWGLTPFWAAVIGFVPLAAQPVGGMIFGSLSDHYGRRSALLLSLLLSGLAAALSGLSFGPIDFAAYRLLLGMVIGGQWAVSMTLVSEVWHAERRGRGVGIVQTSFPVGFIYASSMALWAGSTLGWRALLMLGALPAAFALPLAYFTIRESPVWMADASKETAARVSYGEIFQPGLLRHTVLGTVIMFIGAFGAWSLNPWIPIYLGTLGVRSDKIPGLTLLIMVGAFAGYSLYGFISDRLGRKLTFQIFFVGMALGLASFGFIPSQRGFAGEGETPMVSIVLLGGWATFFLGYFSGYGSLFAELFPTRVRSRGMGFCYSIGGIGGALGPPSTGYLSSLFGIGSAFVIVSLIFLIGAAVVSLFPETKGKRL
jgi:MFS family permease